MLPKLESHKPQKSEELPEHLVALAKLKSMTGQRLLIYSTME